MKIFSGRINYPTYITGKIFFSGIFFVSLIILGYTYDFDRTQFLLIGSIILIPFSFIDSSLDVRRAHDIGRSGTWAVFGTRNILRYFQNMYAQIEYGIKTHQWEDFLRPVPGEYLQTKYGNDFPRWDWMYLDSEDETNQYGEKPKNGITIAALFGF